MVDSAGHSAMVRGRTAADSHYERKCNVTKHAGRVGRREFLKGSAAAGAAVAAGGVAGSVVPTSAQAAAVPAKWDKVVDIVVVGTGHAGLAAAIAATDAGAKVVILEKMKKQ